jgi:eukaryotic-like serine/threonine-protein kinase
VIVRATRRDRMDRFTDGSLMASALAPLVAAKPSDITASLITATEDDLLDGVVGDLEQRPYSGPMPVTRREYARRLTAAFVGGLVLTLVAVFATQALRDPDPGVTASEQFRWPVAATTVFDPTDPGGGDNTELAELASDGDLQTSWVSESYAERDLGPGQDGIGLVFDLGGEHEVRGVTIELVRGGLDVELYASNEMPDAGEGVEAWGDLLAAQSSIRSRQPFLLQPTAQRYWLLWITGLSASSTGEYRAEVSEVVFLGPS